MALERAYSSASDAFSPPSSVSCFPSQRCANVVDPDVFSKKISKIKKSTKCVMYTGANCANDPARVRIQRSHCAGVEPREARRAYDPILVARVLEKVEFGLGVGGADRLEN